MIKDAISRWVEGRDLTEDEAFSCMAEIMSGQATPAQIGGALIALRLKGETASEVAGMVRGMREVMTTVTTAGRDVVDTCGTGGDGAHTFNISTCAAFVAAGAGVCIAKHGNRSVSSKCGSADVFAALGINTNPGPDKVTELLQQIGLAFLFAPAYHPAMKHAIGPRREMGVRTVFNILGPLCNPAGTRRQVIGVFSPEAQELIAEALLRLNAVHTLVVHGSDGLDEITLDGPTAVAEIKDGQLERWEINPNELGLTKAPASALIGGDAEENAQILIDILSGKLVDARRDIVLLNSAAVLLVAGQVNNLGDGLKTAKDSLDNGSAMRVLEEMRKLTPAKD